MNIFKWEVKKLISFPMIWIFLVLCLVFNMIIVFNSTYGKNYHDYLADTAKQTSVTIDENFHTVLNNINDVDNQYYQRLTEETKAMTDVFDDYDISYVGEAYIKTLKVEDTNIADKMRKKYLLMQASVDQKAETNESLSLYLAGDTSQIHWKSINPIIKWLQIEGILFAILTVLLAIEYENIFKTECNIYSSKIGRKIINKKLLAGTIVGILGFIFLTSITLAIFVKLNNYQSIWHSSVSSAFNIIPDLIAGGRPFVTWGSFTVLDYFLSVILVSIGLILCFILMAYGIGLLIRNTYIGFLVVVILNGLFIVLPTYFPNTSIIKYAMGMSPIWLYLKTNMWFTDGGIDILWSHFELRGIIGSLILLITFCILSKEYFRKRDLL